MLTPRRTRAVITLAVAATLTGSLGIISHATATRAPQPPALTIADVKPHLQKFHDIGMANQGNRFIGTGGFTKSLDYIEAQLTAAGIPSTRQKCAMPACIRESENLIAEFPGSDPNSVYVYGAHLDSVKAGPGVNDNASGSSGVLAVALAVKKSSPALKSTVRFAWWTDEENGLNGSKNYVRQLPEADRKKIQAYFNFDMLSSRNGGYFINNITTGPGKVIKEFYDARNIPTEEFEEGRGRSDDASFTKAGILASGIATGARNKATAEHAKKWGLKEGVSFDECYHQACDTFPEGMNTQTIELAINAMLHSIGRLAF